MNTLRSFTETVVTTPTDTFPISFEYDEKYDAVHVFLNDVAVEDLGYSVSQVNAVTLKVEPAIPEGTVRIERETDIDKMKYIFDAGALFIDQNVDADFKQIVHAQQEVRDGFIKLRGDVLPLVHGLQEALQQAQKASEAAQEASEAAQEAADTASANLQGTVYSVKAVSDLDSLEKYSDRIVFVRDNSTFYQYSASTNMWFVRDAHAVSPEMVGGDIIVAAELAKQLKLPLFTGPATYQVSTEFKVPEGTLWVSMYSKVQQTGNALNSSSASVIAPESNVVIKGRLTLDMGAPTVGWGEKCHCRIDSFNNITPKVRGFTADELVLEGGYNNCNGVVMAGGASKVRIRKIEVGDSAVIGRVFMAHWGNFTQHKYDLSLKKYTHVSGYLPTTHPHDCIIDEIHTGDLTCTTSDWSAIALVSAGYDIEIKKITGNILDSTISGKGHFIATAGDLAFAYATPEQRAYGMRGLVVGSINGTSYASSIVTLYAALYATADDLTNVPTPPASEDYYANIVLNVTSVDVTGRAVAIGNNDAIISRLGPTGSLTIDTMITRKFYRSLNIVNGTYNISVGDLTCYDSKVNPVVVNGTGTDPKFYPTGVYINNLTLVRYGVTSSNTVYRSGVSLNNYHSVNIGTLKVLEHGNAYSVVDIANGGGTGLLTVDTIHMLDSTYPSTFLVNNALPTSKYITIGEVSSVKLLTQYVSGGVVKLTRGKQSKYVCAFLPSGLSVQNGDEVFTPSNYATYLCTSAGVVGSTAKLEIVSGGYTVFHQAGYTVPVDSTVLVTSGRNFSNAYIGATQLKAVYSSYVAGLVYHIVMTSDEKFSIYATNITTNPISAPAGSWKVFV
ncbi:tailspike protein [Acinetobacter phage APK77]|uniref:Tailspike protein n=1 Tax=Acinetobacter phage APK77 TaxID=2873389 RepID=A0AAE9BRD0_9CAUD|nr:tailspike protein [Acinetobacter phage APK77]